MAKCVFSNDVFENSKVNISDVSMDKKKQLDFVYAAIHWHTLDYNSSWTGCDNFWVFSIFSFAIIMDSSMFSNGQWKSIYACNVFNFLCDL